MSRKKTTLQSDHLAPFYSVANILSMLPYEHLTDNDPGASRDFPKN
ncbi:hypothetical protein [uncultured Nitrospira sp.]